MSPAPLPARLIRFGAFELDLRAAELRKHGVKVRLQEQPFRILAMLLDRPGEVVLREELQKKLWPNDTIVEFGHGINAAVQRLRDALGDTAGNPRYVETLARRGYRFIGQVETIGQEPARPAASPLQPAPAARVDNSDLTGRTISHYRVLDKIGEGGSGIVYRAEDVKLGRHVALKLVSDHLAEHPAALDRFEQEARAASALSHPNVCTIFEVEEYDGQPAIIMELLEGETLAARLEKAALPIETALAVAIQVAGALDAAHRKGIVHRDLKPRNLVLTPAGVKVLDFGLAGIQPGVIAGTPDYMSPEQSRGEPSDSRSDIFSFGIVLREMLGDRPRQPALQRALDRCLAADPDDRWQSARDLKAELEWIAASSTATPAPAPATARHKSPSRHWFHHVAVAAASAIAVLTAILVWPIATKPKAATQFTVNGPGASMIARLNLSPDGRTLAFSSGGRIYLRTLATSQVRMLEGTDGAGTPFWSPDGRWLSFAAGGFLKKISIAGGGPPTVLCQVNTNIAGAWSPNGTILIGQVGDGLFRVPDTGGVLTRVTSLDPALGETRHMLPQFLPGGTRFLFTAASQKEGVLYAGSIDSAERTALMPIASGVAFVPDHWRALQGYLVFARERTLMAQPFDSSKLRLSGDPFPIAAPLSTTLALASNIQLPDFSAIGDTLAYRQNGNINVIQNWTAIARR
jgi:DNA-binding winged helix-turn-helix (wHTH) protein